MSLPFPSFRTRITLSAVALAAGLFAATPGAAVTLVPLSSTGATYTASFSQNLNNVKGFTETYTFTVPTGGSAAIAIYTNANTDVNRVQFVMAYLNGVPLQISSDGVLQIGTLSSLLRAGSNTLTVKGVATGGGTFSGVISFTPTTSAAAPYTAAESAVPEPATWAMMVAGFAAIGMSLRGQRKRTPLVACAGALRP